MTPTTATVKTADEPPIEPGPLDDIAHGLQKGGKAVTHATVTPSVTTTAEDPMSKTQSAFGDAAVAAGSATQNAVIAPAHPQNALSQELINSTSISGKSAAALAVEHTMAIMKAKEESK